MGRDTSNQIFDATIVLSHRRDHTGKPSKEYLKRLECGIDLILAKKTKHIILCSETATRDIVNYIVHKKVSRNRIILQPNSRNTIQEAIFTKDRILLPYNWKKVIVVSSDYHIRYRASLIFDYILGEDFNIKYIEVSTNKIHNPDVLKDQMRSLRYFLENFVGSIR